MCERDPLQRVHDTGADPDPLMPVQEQRPYIAQLSRGHPNGGETMLRQQLQQQGGVPTIMFLPPCFGAADRGRMTHLTRDPQFLHQPQEPAHRSGRFNADHHGRWQRGIEGTYRVRVVGQRSFDDLSRLAIQHRNRLLACV